MHQAQYFLVVHPYAIILLQEQLDLAVAVFPFVARIHLTNEQCSFLVPVHMFALQIGVISATRDLKEFA
ncbi:hypothetical protein XI25_07625 [Paenibacillus sp. DMB20]|nr:hypothetical protein XI25_07625 [Paenibacillus sp. DMB20]